MMRGGGRRVRVGALVRFVSGLVALAALSVVAALVLIGAVGAAYHRAAPVVTISGSMAPALDTGDVVVVRAFEGGGVDPGAVVMFRDESRGLVTHRVVDRNDDGTFVTKGDANADPDSIPLDADELVATAAMVVPWVGSPAAWYANGQWLLLAIALVGSTASGYLAFGALDPYRDPWGDGGARPGRRTILHRLGRRRDQVPWAPIPLCLLVAAGLAAVATTEPASAGFAATTANQDSIIDGAASFPCTTFPDVVTLTGFESGLVAFGSSGLSELLGSSGGLPTIDGAVQRHGGFSLRVPKTSDGTSYAGSSSTAGAHTARFAIRFETLPSANVVQLYSINAAAGSSVSLGYDATTSKLTWGFAGTTPPQSSTTLTAGTWYVVQVRANFGIEPRTADWRVDAVGQTTSSLAEPASSVSSVLLGTTITADRYTAYYDDVTSSYTPTDYPIADGRVLALQPDGMGTHVGATDFRDHNGVTIDATSHAHLQMGDYNTYLAQTTQNAGSYLSATFHDTAAACIRGVAATVAFDSTSSLSANYGKTSIMVGSTERTIFAGNQGTYYPEYRVATIAPTAATWDTATLNGLTARFGFSSDIDPEPRWVGLLLQYDTRLAPS